MGAEATPRDPAAGSDRLIVRPTLKIWLLTACSMGAASVVGAWASIEILLHGRWVGLIILAVSIGLAGMIYANLGGYLWADAEQVGSTVPAKRWRSRRGEIAEIRIGRRIDKMGAASWDFLRADGSLAYTADGSVFGEKGLSKITDFLAVPVVDWRKKR